MGICGCGPRATSSSSRCEGTIVADVVSPFSGFEPRISTKATRTSSSFLLRILLSTEHGTTSSYARVVMGVFHNFRSNLLCGATHNTIIFNRLRHRCISLLHRSLICSALALGQNKSLCSTKLKTIRSENRRLFRKGYVIDSKVASEIQLSL